MYPIHRRRKKPDRPITQHEAIMMIKQLGMMHILYYMRVKVYHLLKDFEQIREMLAGKTPEQVILSWINTENRLIEHLSEWEKNYIKDMTFKKVSNENGTRN